MSDGSFVKNSATYYFSNLGCDFDVNKIGNVRFQYGTNLAEASLTSTKKKVPEPSIIFTLSAFAVGSLAMKKKRTNSAL